MLHDSAYLTPSAALAATGLSLDGVGWITQKRRRQVARRPNYAGLLVTAGHGTLELEGRTGTHRLGPGSFFWLPPGVEHAYGPDAGGWSERWILFHGPATTGYEELGLLTGRQSVTQLDNPSALISSFRNVEALARRPDHLARDLALGTELHAIIQAVHGARERPVDDVGQAAVDHLTEHAFGPVGIRELARDLHVSQDTLVARVKALTGSTPSGFLIRRRLAYAKELLTATALPVAQVARLVGYQDPGYFTRLFTERVGLPPSEFRRMEAQGPTPR